MISSYNKLLLIYACLKPRRYHNQCLLYLLATILVLEKLLYFESQSFLMSCYFAKIFVRLLVMAAVCSFNVYKLIGWDPANIYLFKVNSRSTKKWSDICPKLPINSLESCSGVFIVSFEHYPHFFFSVSTVDFEQVNVCQRILSCLNIITQSNII